MDGTKMKKPTIRDIAKMAGVSHSTVSRSLNDSELISGKTKSRIKKIADDLGFEFNTNARSLSTSKTGTIGVILPEGFDEIMAGFFFGSLVKIIREHLEKERFDNIIDFRINPFTGENNIKKLINSKKVDGLILAESRLTEDDWEYIKRAGIPAVLVHFKPEFVNYSDIEYICTDQFLGGYIASEHLIKYGHKKILTFTHIRKEEPFREFADRTEGYKAALRDNGILSQEEDVIYCDITFEAAFEKVNQEIEKIRKYTAIFVQTDLMALGVMKALKKNGIRVPEDISVVGYDDIEFCRYSEPELTTIHQPKEELADIACQRLLEKLHKDNKGIFQKIIEPDLIIRESTMKLK